MTFASQTGSPAFSGGVTFGAQFNPTGVVVSVASEPVDLAVTAVALTTATAAPGEAVTVNYTVKNQCRQQPVRARGPTRCISDAREFRFFRSALGPDNSLGGRGR